VGYVFGTLAQMEPIAKNHNEPDALRGKSLATLFLWTSTQIHLGFEAAHVQEGRVGYRLL
jgi:aspartate carbamoyltransferase catalytic subunit